MRLITYALFFIVGIFCMFITGVFLYALSFDVLNIDDIILMSFFEGSFISFFLLATNRLINGGYFSENSSVSQFLMFGLGYGISETYFYLYGAVDMFEIMFQRFFFTFWGDFPIPGTLFIVLTCTTILGYSAKNKIIYFLVGIPLVIFIIFTYTAFIF